jgi:hypothetical protein
MVKASVPVAEDTEDTLCSTANSEGGAKSYTFKGKTKNMKPKTNYCSTLCCV